MAPGPRKLSLSLVCIAPLLSSGFVISPHAALHDVVARGENDVATATPTLTFTVSPCPISGCGPAAPTSTQDNDCSTVQANLSEVDAKEYSVICNVDFPGQNILPFLHVTCFDDCKSKCSDYNNLHNDSSCAGFVYAPARIDGTDDCYLKSSLNHPTAAKVHLIGATVIATTATSASFTYSTASTSSTVSASTTASISTTLKASPSAQAQKDQPLVVALSSSTGQAAPVVVKVTELGTSVNKPTNKYVSHLPAIPVQLGSALLKSSINTDLITGYSLAADTGIYTSNKASKANAIIATMKTVPKLARDGGKGGMINGTHVVYFCDTGVTSDGQLVSLVSSSIATDNSMNALQGKSLELVDNLGEWQDDVGRMRGFAPMTQGEEAYNKAMAGSGYRYAIWPESSPTSINSTHALIYASIVYDQVDMSTQQYQLSSLGNTVLVVAIDPDYGPYSSRPITQLFKQGQITYGSLGGFRAWGKDGLGKLDGEIYLFGLVPNGVFLAKTYPTTYTFSDSYSYWDGHSWSFSVPDLGNSDALILKEPVKDFEIIYAPAHQNFIMIYLTNLADNTFYFRTCKAMNIIPPYMPNGQSDWAEAIHACEWSDRAVLYHAPTPQREFIYAGGVHAGYYGTLDITNGGQKMLISWTEKVGQDATSSDAGYAHKTAYVDWATNNVWPCPDGATSC